MLEGAGQSHLQWVSSRLYLPERPFHEGIQYDRSPQWQATAHAINVVLCRPRTREGP